MTTMVVSTRLSTLGFEEERHFVDHHSMGFEFSDPTHESLLHARDTGVDDLFKLA